jgi:hypothetical protein
MDRIVPFGNREGAPGMFIDAQFGAHIDNLRVTRND